MSTHATPSRFESAVLEHLDAAYNLARWLTRRDQDARDVVQESCMKALRAFDTFRGGDFRAWFLAIVRNTSFTWLRGNRGAAGREGDWSLDAGAEAGAEIAADSDVYDPQEIAMRAADAETVRRAIDRLPPILREAVVLREMEGLSYKEIGKIAGVPIGTVMSRLARGRARLQVLLAGVDASDSRKSAPEGAL